MCRGTRAATSLSWAERTGPRSSSDTATPRDRASWSISSPRTTCRATTTRSRTSSAATAHGAPGSAAGRQRRTGTRSRFATTWSSHVPSIRSPCRHQPQSRLFPAVPEAHGHRGTAGFCDSTPPVAWQQLELQEVLGQGASGVIYKAHWLPQKKTVALKVFKGAVTSDGLPEDERDTFIAAGAHPGLVTLFGQLDGHPEGTTGLVMELIDPKFYNLGQPPSLASCSRDVMSHSKPITTQKAVNIAATIASVAAQLHKRGISHGDLYAHNTLVDDEGNTLFGDFGAATFYDRANTSLAAALERLEVCAFGHLIDDLLQICVPDNNHHTRHNLTRLRDAATQPNVLSRPDFAQLHEELMELMER
ncbi:MAG: hypothetical protein EBZ77_09380 [Chitinophagia bacterium]|nr:hypothetical protein [Chitinophagia bacterium]